MHNLKFIAYRSKRCEDAEKLRNEVDEFVDFIQERENLKQLIADVEEKLADYWETVNDTDNEARCHQGKIFIVVASSLVPVAGWVSKSTKVKKILEWIKKATPDDLLKLKSRLTNDGVLQLQCDEARSQHKNKDIVIQRFFEVLKNALAVPKKRKPTKPTKSSVEKRLKLKKMSAERKALRRKSNWD